MAYLGRRGVSAPLTSADIPAGSVSAIKVASDVATQAELDAQKTNSSITTLGTVTAGNLSNSAIVYPAGSVLKIHPFTNQNLNYNLTSTTAVSTGTGTTFTTLANTTAFVLDCKGSVMYYEPSGNLPSGYTSVHYHSSPSATGQAPTGAQIGYNETLGGNSPSAIAAGRWDLYLQYTFSYYVSCSGSTTYTIQVFGHRTADIYYMDFTYGTGIITELSG
jgi:hypothetical protein|tara:strand:- start:259 stop:915 length:657 start_codon:yes stop_codon:yes gene_type:complete